MRTLTHSEISNALVRGHFERSKQFHFLLSLLFKSNSGHTMKHASKSRTAVKTRIAA